MPRKPSDTPWLHSSSGFWCATIEGRRTYLDKDFETARRKLKRLKSRLAQQANGHREWLDAAFSELADEYLSDIKARRAAGTYRNYREQLLRAMRLFGTDLKVSELRRFHLAKVERAMVADYSAATIRDTLATVQQVFNWAVRNDLVESNPLTGYQKPTPTGRTRLVTPQEFALLLRHTDAGFRRFLMAMRLTGCRPGELRSLTWEMVHLDDGLWILKKHKTITMQANPVPRVIPLPDPVWKMCRWLDRQPHERCDHVFLNGHGGHFSKDCLVRKMSRLRQRAGIEARDGENLVLYSNRHTYATSSVGKVSDTELAELLGHSNTRTLRRYVHLNANRLRDIQRRAQE